MSPAVAQQPPAAGSRSLSVELGTRSYPIIIGSRNLEEVGPRLADMLGRGRAAVVDNPTVSALYLDRVLKSLRDAGFQTTAIEIPDGEEHKNIASLTFIYDCLLDASMERGNPIIALGGGVIGDLAGFAAATFLRGVPLVQLPTTLLAQVDSSVGGKTGINHPQGKNLIGAFYQPRLVLIDITTLETLPRRQLVAGLSEVIKYGAILDTDLFALVEHDLDRILALDRELLQQIIHRCCALKAMVVHRDEHEADYRSILNFGHTIGHAVERLTGYKRYLHGEAIAIGMAFAVELSHVRGYCDEGSVRRLVELLKRAGLPVAIPSEFLGEALALAVASDKKVAGGKVKFVCLERIGQTRFEYLTDHEIAEFAEH